LAEIYTLSLHDALPIFIEEATTYLGIACVSLCRLLDPQMIVFAGGLILAGENLFAGVRASFAEHDWTILRSKVAIVPAQLGNQRSEEHTSELQSRENLV